MIRMALIVLAAAAIAGRAAPESPAESDDQSKPAIEDLGDGRLKIGLVTIEQKTRSISFPAEINMIEGLLEFAVVHQNGKIHEALLHTRVNPFNLNVALKLLRYQPSEELFPILDADYRPTNKYPDVSEETKNAARVEILVGWKNEEGGAREVSLNDLITHTVTDKPLPALPWIYGGSYIHNGSFQARATGDIAAIFTANTALFNYPGTNRELDDVWIPTPKRVPPVGTQVTVTIKPFTRKAPTE